MGLHVGSEAEVAVVVVVGGEVVGSEVEAGGVGAGAGAGVGAEVGAGVDKEIENDPQIEVDIGEQADAEEASAVSSAHPANPNLTPRSPGPDNPLRYFHLQTPVSGAASVFGGDVASAKALSVLRVAVSQDLELDHAYISAIVVSGGLPVPVPATTK